MNRIHVRRRWADAVRRLGVLAVALVVCPVATAQEHQHAPGREQYQAEPKRVTDPPAIDGLLDEAVWATAPPLESFTQQEPSDGEPATERTVVRLLYDATALYIGVYAHDSDPAGVIATEMRRDSPRLLEEDNFQLILDTFRDSRSGYMFVTNPLGAKLEQQVFEEGGDARGSASNINRDWNGVWSAAARRTNDGWTAEIMIPMVTLRSPDVPSQLWGINFMRNIRRKNEQVFWAPIPKPYGLTQVSMAGTLGGMTNLTRGLDLRVKPFVVAGGRRDRSGDNVARKALRDAGLDVKYGMGSGLALDVTLNTDFAQAEVDEQQVNLTRFPLFFPEKRDFFLENSGLFTVGNQSNNERVMDLFFSRRIGLSDTGQPIPIIGGARMTGKVGGHNLAVMDIQTDRAFDQPGDNFLIARYSKDLFGRSKVGGLVINKETSGNSHFNRMIVADTVLAPTRSLTFHTFLARTSTPGVSDDQQAFYARALLLNTKWQTFAEYTDIQDHFNAEVGFVPRTGIRTTKVHIERNPRPGGWIRVMEPMFNITNTTDQHNRLLTRRLHHMVGTRLKNGAYINFMYNRLYDRIDVPFTLQNKVTIPTGEYWFWQWFVVLNSNPSRRFYALTSFSPQTFYDGTRKDTDVTLGVRATDRVSTELSVQRNDVKLPWGDFVVNLWIVRLDYALSPRMTVRALSQYNSLTRQLSTSVRYNVIYRPGSDVFVVYDEFQGNTRGLPEVRNRQLVVKMTYLLSR